MGGRDALAALRIRHEAIAALTKKLSGQVERRGLALDAKGCYLKQKSADEYDKAEKARAKEKEVKKEEKKDSKDKSKDSKDSSKKDDKGSSKDSGKDAKKSDKKVNSEKDAKAKVLTGAVEP